jgi:hypothetical protein
MLLQTGAETNVYVRSSHSTQVATCVSRQERTCTCVPAEGEGEARLTSRFSAQGLERTRYSEKPPPHVALCGETAELEVNLLPELEARLLAELEARLLAEPEVKLLAELEVKLPQPGAETNVYVRSSHSTQVATCVSRQERTCTCVPAEVREVFFGGER